MKHLFFFILASFIAAVSHCQELPAVDFIKLTAEISIDPVQEKITGEVAFLFDVLEPTDSIAIDAVRMTTEDVFLNGKPIKLENDGKQLILPPGLEPSENNLLEFSYTASPSQTMYFIGWDNPPASEYGPQVWTQGQGKYTSHWLPSFDDVTEKLQFDLSFILPKELTAISNGKLVGTTEPQTGLRRWEFDMVQPMSSYLVMLAAGKYYKEEVFSESAIPISNYFYPGDEEKVEPTYRYTQQIFDFFEKEIGLPYPWQNYKQVPVRDFLYSGMENTTATVFSDRFVIDSIGFSDRNYVMVNAHELAHQWFGNLVTAASSEHHWLQEGFATYFALLAEREIFGDAYYYWTLFQTAEQLKFESDQGKGQAVMNPKAGSLTFYQKGAWALHILKERIGVEAFSKGLQNYLEKYQYQSVTTDQFLTEMESASGIDLTNYKKDWLIQSAFQATEALSSLRKSPFINEYLAIAALRETPLEAKKDLLFKALDFPVNEYIRQEVVQQLAYENPEEVSRLYQKAFESNHLLVRQAIALSLEEIPLDLKSEFESLLNDASYVTLEGALYALWMNFPADRIEYLTRTEGIEGLPNKNVRMLWLALNLATPEYQPDNLTEVFRELSGYTDDQYPFYVRINAFRNLFQLNTFTDQNLQDLLQGTQHPVSSFRQFCRELVKELIANPSYRSRFESIIEILPRKQKAYLEQLL